MTLIVSRETTAIDGQKVCSRCGIRPRPKKGRYCSPCNTEYNREWRAGRVQMLVSPEERETVLAARRLAARYAPRHAL